MDTPPLHTSKPIQRSPELLAPAARMMRELPRPSMTAQGTAFGARDAAMRTRPEVAFPWTQEEDSSSLR